MARKTKKKKTTKAPVFLVNLVTVVVTAEFHNPSILNPDFLKSLEIVPAEWQVEDTMTTPAISTVNYDNGISWSLEPGKLQIRERCEGGFQDSYEIFEIVTKYIGILPHVPYKHLGLNWQGTMLRHDPTDWLVRRFLRPGAWERKTPKVVNLAPKFLFEAADAACSVTLNSGTTRRGQDDPKSAIIYKANFHHPDLLTVRKFQKALRNWQERQEFLIEVLTRLLRSRQK